jgi:hypothetical protein
VCRVGTRYEASSRPNRIGRTGPAEQSALRRAPGSSDVDAHGEPDPTWLDAIVGRRRVDGFSYVRAEGNPSPVRCYQDLLAGTEVSTLERFFGRWMAVCYARMGDPIPAAR